MNKKVNLCQDLRGGEEVLQQKKTRFFSLRKTGREVPPPFIFTLSIRRRSHLTLAGRKREGLRGVARSQGQKHQDMTPEMLLLRPQKSCVC